MLLFFVVRTVFLQYHMMQHGQHEEAQEIIIVSQVGIYDNFYAKI